MEKCFEIIILYQENNKNISHTFWQTSIETLMKLKKIDYTNHLLKLYPIKYCYSESSWKNVLIFNINLSQITHLFQIFLEKFDCRNNNDEFKGFENIFNIFIEEITSN